MADKHKDCKYYDRIDEEKGFCTAHPPIFHHKDEADRYPIVEKNGKACGEFEAEE